MIPAARATRFLADQILMIDTYNPSVASRLVEPLASWRRYVPELGALIRAQLEPDRRGRSPVEERARTGGQGARVGASPRGVASGIPPRRRRIVAPCYTDRTGRFCGRPNGRGRVQSWK